MSFTITSNNNNNNSNNSNNRNCNGGSSGLSSCSSGSGKSNTVSLSCPTTQISVNFTSTHLFQVLCIVGVCFLCYYNATQCGLVFDDISAIRDNKDLRPSTPLKNIFLNDFWGTPMHKEQSHKSYRPLTVLTFRVNYWLHELQPYGYHMVNVLLHVAVCLLWRRVCRLLVAQCTGSPYSGESLANRCSFVAALLFAVHPVHTEAVTGVVGRAELLSSLFFLGAFLSYARAVAVAAPVHWPSLLHPAKTKTRWLTLCFSFGSCLLASMLCKEQGITVAGVCAAYELFVVQELQPSLLWLSFLQLFEERHSVSNASSPKVKAATARLATSSPSAVALSTSSSSSSSSSSLSSSRNSIAWSSTLVKRLSFIVLITVSLLVGRIYVMGSQLPVFTRFDNPASAADTPVRQLTFSYLIYLNAWLLLLPCDLCCDWTMGTVPLIESLSDVRNIATLLTFAVLAALTMRACMTCTLRHSRVLLMCLTWMVLPFLPASNLFFPVGFVVAERILYMPSMGFCLLIAYGYYELQQKITSSSGGGGNSLLKYLAKAALVLLLVTHAARTYRRNYDWRNEYTIFMSGVHVNGRNAKLFNNVGHALENEGRYAEALVYFQQAVNIQPDDIGAHINVGRTYNNLKMYGEAEAAYLRAKELFPRIKPGESYQARIAPNHLNVFINLANLIARNRTRLEEADLLYRQAISMRADYVQAYINRGDILMKLNRTAQAQEVYEKALLYDSENADIYYNLGVVFLEQGKSAQAHVYFNKAIELFPGHEQALLNSAILLQEMGGVEARQLSRERLHKILTQNSNNEKVFFNLGMLAMDESDFESAEQYFKRAIHLKEDFRSALFNLALLLADANRPLDAVPYLNQLIRYYPAHIKGLILLGDIYINHMKDLNAAEACYRNILKYEPQNVQGLHNLCVVFVERKRLAKAQSCLRYAHHLAPHEDYIMRHLQIVQTRLRKIAKLPDSSHEKQAAFTDYDPSEFMVPPH